MYSGEQQQKPVTVATLADMKSRGEKIACLTAYDASFATLLDECGVDVVLVGDSLGNVIQGRATTHPVTMNHMVYHTRAVRGGLERAFLIGDMPWMSFRSESAAARNAGRLMAAGASMVKLEGGGYVADVTAHLVERGVPVCGHLGLTPQWVHKFGGFRVQGKTESAAEAMRREALRLQEAGAELLVLECVPAGLAERVSGELAIPTIGIGAGPGCDGQVLVVYDMLGLTPGKRPKFSKDFTGTGGGVRGAVTAYVEAVRQGAFPGAEHSF